MIRQTPEEVAIWICNNIPAVRPQYGPEDVAGIAKAIQDLVDLKMRNLGVHLSHCNFGENAGGCKYGDPDCPALAGWSWFGRALDK